MIWLLVMLRRFRLVRAARGKTLLTRLSLKDR